MNRRHNIVVSDLCAEIDELTNSLAYANEQVRYWRNLCAVTHNESIKHSHKMMGNVLVEMLKKTPKAV